MAQTAPYSPFRRLSPGDGILMAFSGGVDSTVAAVLALRAGYRVTAVHMTLLPGSGESRAKAEAAEQRAAKAEERTERALAEIGERLDAFVARMEVARTEAEREEREPRTEPAPQTATAKKTRKTA